MTIETLKIHFTEKLDGIYPSEEVESFFFLLVENFLKLSKVDTVLQKQDEVSEAIQKQFKSVIKRLQTHEPIQYILGSTEFYGLNFKVTPATLIPRPETEELVDWIIRESISPSKGVRGMFRKPPLQLLDIGTGSGCIAISLANNLPNAEVSAIDISEDALKVALENALYNKVAVNFIQQDILKSENLPQKYDVIVSNPPYVRNSEKERMQKNVLDFEPPSALFVEDNNPLLFYSKIIQLAKNYLNPKGFLFFEINEYLSEEVIQLLESESFINIELKKDFFGKDRMIKCTLGE